ncbi:MAG: hypothetical protein GY820_39145 [Gammaproteobacteria bacterium]|nr:hypothetical protein [Gammaproteobacteria bacterium]
MKTPDTIPHPFTDEPVTISALAKRYGVAASTIRSRYRRGNRGKDLVKRPAASGYRRKWNLENMQPRQKVRHIKPVGSWEEKNIPKSKVHNKYVDVGI